MAEAKGARLNVRLRASDDELTRRAAMQSGQTITEFLTESAIDRAHEVLADQRSFTLDAATWDRFVARLDQPARVDPRVAELFARPQRIAR